MSRPIIPGPLAYVVLDVIDTVAELRRASEALLKARSLPQAKVWAIEATSRAEAHVRELTERIQSRARSAGIAENDLMAAAFDVLDGRRLLPPAESEEAA